MKVWDERWPAMMRDLMVKIEMACRYMDDGRTALHPFKAGWRCSDGCINYCARWAKEDEGILGLERSKLIVQESIKRLEEYDFTMETENDFPDGFLPSLDTSLKVDSKNIILFKFV